MSKQSKSQRIRTLLSQGKSTKDICKMVKCEPSLVYQVKAYDKRKTAKKTVPTWKSAGVVTSATSIVKDRQKEMQESVLNALAAKPGAIRYGDIVMVPKDYAVPKRNFVQRFFSWLCGN